MKQKIATIFGASGFIGRNLIRRLTEKDYDFSTLTEDQQDVYNLINYQQHKFTKMADLSSGAITPRRFWTKFHATLGKNEDGTPKFTEEERFAAWAKSVQKSE